METEESMHKVRNKTSQPLVLNTSGRVLHLLPGSYALVGDEDVKRPEMQGLLREKRIECFDIAEPTELKRAPKRGSKTVSGRKAEGE
jgi:hypothetical protein